MRPGEAFMAEIGATLPREVLIAAGKYAAAIYGDGVAKLEIRKRAMEWAVELAGPHSPGYSGEEIAVKVEQIADRIYAYMTKDKPDITTEIK